MAAGSIALTMQERLALKCEQKFGGMDIELAECYYLLVAIFQLETSNVSGCFPLGTPPEITHNADLESACSTVERRIAQYAVPVLQLLCLIGNVLNLLVYRLPYFHGSSAVYFLRAKALANLVFVESRTLEVVHAWLYAFRGIEKNGADLMGASSGAVIAEWWFEAIYWRTRPLIITIANICGTLSTWMTLYITIETVICVLLPFSFRKYCTRKKTLWLLLASLLTSLALHLIFLCTHEVNSKIVLHNALRSYPTLPTPLNQSNANSASVYGSNSYQAPPNASSIHYNSSVDEIRQNFHAIRRNQSALLATKSRATADASFDSNGGGGIDSSASAPELERCWLATQSYAIQPIETLLPYEKIYYWLQMTASIVLPTLAMLVCSLLIITQFTFKELGEGFSQRRKCVIRLTVATTLSHLLLEGPALLTFTAVASKGAFVQHHNTELCVMNHANNLLSMLNATIPFFVFLACNHQFRKMSAVYLRGLTRRAIISSDGLSGPAGTTLGANGASGSTRCGGTPGGKSLVLSNSCSVAVSPKESTAQRFIIARAIRLAPPPSPAARGGEHHKHNDDENPALLVPAACCDAPLITRRVMNERLRLAAKISSDCDYIQRIDVTMPLIHRNLQLQNGNYCNSIYSSNWTRTKTRKKSAETFCQKI